MFRRLLSIVLHFIQINKISLQNSLPIGLNLVTAVTDSEVLLPRHVRGLCDVLFEPLISMNVISPHISGQIYEMGITAIVGEIMGNLEYSSFLEQYLLSSAGDDDEDDLLVALLKEV
jgi:hypothetical protein